MEKEDELEKVRVKLEKEQKYREHITKGVNKWREEFTGQTNQKLEHTRERLEDEVKENQRLKERNRVLEKGLSQQKLLIIDVRTIFFF